jgi:hypothetical protein
MTAMTVDGGEPYPEFYDRFVLEWVWIMTRNCGPIP